MDGKPVPQNGYLSGKSGKLCPHQYHSNRYGPENPHTKRQHTYFDLFSC
jgi:hypothetical protein